MGQRLRRGTPSDAADEHAASSVLRVTKPITSTARKSGCVASSPKSIDMPTAMKKRPISRPLKGSMSVSRACRYSEPASKTPARNAPSAMEMPGQLHDAARCPMTSSSANAGEHLAEVRLRDDPQERLRRVPPDDDHAQRWRRRPSPDRAHRKPPPPDPSCASRGTIATSGMAAMSWKSRIPNAVLPIGRGEQAALASSSARRWPSTTAPRARPGDERAPPRAGLPPAPPPARTAPHTPICTAPPPKTLFRMAQRRPGSSSSPMRKSMRTTPNSAKCRIDFDVAHQAAGPRGRWRTPPIEVPEHRAELEPARHAARRRTAAPR